MDEPTVVVDSEPRDAPSRRLRLALACGALFGVVDVLLMIPISIEHKSTAMFAAFLDRFAIGFLILTVRIPLPAIVKGLLIGAWLSASAAVVTGAWIPILGIGLVGGGLIGAMEAIAFPECSHQ